jgi:hypothetical protein
MMSHEITQAPPLYFFSPSGREWLTNLLSTGAKFTLGFAATILNFKKTMMQKNPEFLQIVEKSSKWFTRQSRFSYRYENHKSAISVTRPWMIAGHGYLTGKLDPKGMWHRELQQHTSLYREIAGIIFGGGNSLAQEEFSTLLTAKSYLCDRVRVEKCDESSQTVVCENGSWKIAIHSTILNANESTVKCEVLKCDDAPAFWQLTLALLTTRKQLMYQNTVVTDFSEKTVSGSFEKSIVVLGENSDKKCRIEIDFSTPCHYQWPLYPVDVRKPGSKPLPIYNAVLPLKFALPEKGKSIDIHVKYSE